MVLSPLQRTRKRSLHSLTHSLTYAHVQAKLEGAQLSKWRSCTSPSITHSSKHPQATAGEMDQIHKQHPRFLRPASSWRDHGELDPDKVKMIQCLNAPLFQIVPQMHDSRMTPQSFDITLSSRFNQMTLRSYHASIK
jgi:hypothetical protein